MSDSSLNHFRFAQWDITSRCNLACKHCRSESSYGDSHLACDLPLVDVKLRLDHLWQQGVRRIHFLGGEPFVRTDLATIVEYASSLGIICSINTNGTLITADVARAIMSAGTYLITLSLDGHDAATNDRIRGRGAFRRALRGLRHLHEAKSALGAHTRLICSHTLMQPNHLSVDKMIDRATEAGFQNLIISSLRRMGAANRNYEELALSPKASLQVAEAAARRLQRGRHCHVQYEAVSLLGKIYLNAKYSLSLPVYRSGCDATTSKAFIQSGGRLFPCQDTAPTLAAARDRRPRPGSFDDWSTGIGVKIANAINSLATYENYSPCSQCPALGQLCVPCPLAALSGRRVARPDCARIIKKAKAEGVDLEKGISLAVRRSAVSRVLASPSFRRQALFSEYPNAVFGGIRDEHQHDQLLSLSSQPKDETRSLLAACVAELDRRESAGSSTGAGLSRVSRRGCRGREEVSDAACISG